MTSITSLCEMACKFVQKKLEEKQLEEERAAKAQNWKLPVCYDADDDEKRSDSLDDNIISGLPPFSAITPNEPVLSIEEPDNSLNHFEDFFESNEEFSQIDETDCDFEEDIRLKKKFLYDNSSPRPPEEFVSANSDAKIKFFSPSPILVKDSDSLMEEIDLFCTLDYPMPSGIEDDDYDSERDILIHKDLLSNNTLSFAKKESFYFDIPPFSRPPAKPSDGDTRILNIKMMGDIYDQKAFMHKLIITLASHQKKSPDLLSHRGLEAFQPFAKCPMMIHGQNNPILDVLLFYFYPH
uniref:Reverse transcriptase domain-containing protein n=1 Tax=Tanacetum cinerariifolium TaxID=118510 RepID=A0A699KN52_TANCI|nr:hypothetical protein [Tanacetum cinerariifolium]